MIVFSIRSLSLLVCLLSIFSARALYMDLEYGDEFVIQNGLVSPFSVMTIENQTAEIILVKTVEGQKKCLLMTPTLEIIDLDAPVYQRFSKGNSECSAKIASLKLNDTGRWRLQSINGNDSIEGVSSVFVKQLVDNAPQMTVSLFEGKENTSANFFDKISNYCSLYREDLKEFTFVRGECVLPIKKVSKNLQGNWKVTAGVPGQVEEKITEVFLDVKAENIDMGTAVNTAENSATLYCNLKNTEKSLVFCRFERSADGKGFNLVDGLGNDRYEYFGSGLRNNECGLRIRDLKPDDFGGWKCFLGLELEDETTEVISRLLQLKKQASRMVSQDTSMTTFLATKNQPMEFEIEAPESLSYCRLEHPNGTIFRPIPQTKFATYWYDESKLTSGICSFHIAEITETDNGVWKCSMGFLSTIGVESVKEVFVRVTGPLAAVDENVKAKYGQSATLLCRTTGRKHSLKYCRFTTPDNIGFNINDNIRKNNSIMGEYYFPENAYLYMGDCSVTIDSVSEKHFGKWICAAMIDEQNEEHLDYVTLHPEEITKQLSTASVTGITFGVIIACGILATIGYLTFRRRQAARQERESEPVTARTTVEPIVHFRPSGESDSSGAEIMSPEIQGTSFYGTESQGH